MTLAVSEAVTNAIIHAFVGRERGRVAITAEAGEGCVLVRVLDDGRGMTPHPESPGLGLGLTMMASMATRCDIREAPSGDGTEVRLAFDTPGVAGPARDRRGRRPLRAAARGRADRRRRGLARRGPRPARRADRAADRRRLHDRHRRRVRRAAAAWPRTTRGPAGRSSPPTSRRGGRRASRPSSPWPRCAPASHGSSRSTPSRWARSPTTTTRRAGSARWTSRTGSTCRCRSPTSCSGSLGLGLSPARSAPEEQLPFLQALAERAARGFANTQLISELRRTRQRLERILGVLAEAVTVHDERGKLVYANAAAVTLLGARSRSRSSSPPSRASSRRVHHHARGRHAGAGVDLPGRRLLAGETAPTLLTRSVERSTGRGYWLLTKATMLDDGGTLAVNIIEDVTEAKNAERRQRFLAEAGEMLVSSRDHERDARARRALVVPTLADWCALDLVDETGDLQRVALVHHDPDKRRLGRRAARALPAGARHRPGARRRAARRPLGARPPRSPTRCSGTARDAEHLRLLRELGIRSAMLVALRVQGRRSACCRWSTPTAADVRRGRPRLRRGGRAARGRRGGRRPRTRRLAVIEGRGGQTRRRRVSAPPLGRLSARRAPS